MHTREGEEQRLSKIIPDKTAKGVQSCGGTEAILKALELTESILYQQPLGMSGMKLGESRKQKAEVAQSFCQIQ